MPIQYSEIVDYWTKNPCYGGNQKFPFWYWKGKKVLEIGAGLGRDAERFLHCGALYTGIDVSIDRLPHIKRMNAEYLDFPDNYFDLVYSWGVIHHAVNPQNIVNEAYRVVKKDGFICIMLYNKFSFRYLIEIMFLRKILWSLNYPKYRVLKLKEPFPTKEQWISWNTDNLGCPLSRVYTKKEAMNLLNKFNITETWTENKGWFRVLIGKK